MAGHSAEGHTVHLPLVTPIAGIVAVLAIALGSYGVVTGLDGTSGEWSTGHEVPADEGSDSVGVSLMDGVPGEMRTVCIEVTATPACP